MPGNLASKLTRIGALEPTWRQVQLPRIYLDELGHALALRTLGTPDNGYNSTTSQYLATAGGRWLAERRAGWRSGWAKASSPCPSELTTAQPSRRCRRSRFASLPTRPNSAPRSVVAARSARTLNRTRNFLREPGMAPRDSLQVMLIAKEHLPPLMAAFTATRHQSRCAPLPLHQ